MADIQNDLILEILKNNWWCPRGVDECGCVGSTWKCIYKNPCVTIEGYTTQPCTCKGFKFKCNRGGCLLTGAPVVVYVTDTEASLVNIEDVKPGMRVHGGGVVKKVIIYDLGIRTDYVQVRDIHVTLWHPYKTSGGTWGFPDDLNNRPYTSSSAPMVDLILDEYHNSFGVFDHINSEIIEFASMGHGHIEPYHPYWGTGEVLKDLEKHPDWESGVVTIKQVHFQRHPQTGEVYRQSFWPEPPSVENLPA